MQFSNKGNDVTGNPRQKETAATHVCDSFQQQRGTVEFLFAVLGSKERPEKCAQAWLEKKRGERAQKHLYGHVHLPGLVHIQVREQASRLSVWQ